MNINLEKETPMTESKAPITWSIFRRLYLLRFERGGKKHNLGSHKNKLVLEVRYANWMTRHHMELSDVWFDRSTELIEQLEDEEGIKHDQNELHDLQWDSEGNTYVGAKQ